MRPERSRNPERKNSIERINASEIMHELEEEGTVVVGAIYDIETGKVEFLDN